MSSSSSAAAEDRRPQRCEVQLFIHVEPRPPGAKIHDLRELYDPPKHTRSWEVWHAAHELVVDEVEQVLGEQLAENAESGPHSAPEFLRVFLHGSDPADYLRQTIRRHGIAVIDKSTGARLTVHALPQGRGVMSMLDSLNDASNGAEDALDALEEEIDAVAEGVLGQHVEEEIRARVESPLESARKAVAAFGQEVRKAQVRLAGRDDELRNEMLWVRKLRDKLEEVAGDHNECVKRMDLAREALDDMKREAAQIAAAKSSSKRPADASAGGASGKTTKKAKQLNNDKSSASCCQSVATGNKAAQSSSSSSSAPSSGGAIGVAVAAQAKKELGIGHKAKLERVLSMTLKEAKEAIKANSLAAPEGETRGRAAEAVARVLAFEFPGEDALQQVRDYLAEKLRGLWAQIAAACVDLSAEKDAGRQALENEARRVEVIHVRLCQMNEGRRSHQN
ncbi:unnamed protein product [Amoebophrya sp. A120]|nr:unnamed protein product [Amoebophrya sp. A120]|eukprot:GSA120T00022550001.1